MTPARLDEALAEQQREGRRLGETLLLLEAVTEEQIARALAEQWGYPYINLSVEPPLPEALALLPAEIAERYQVVPVKLQGRELLVAMSDPFHYESMRDVSFASGLRVQPAVSAHGAILRVIEERYKRKSPIDRFVEETASEQEAQEKKFPLQILPSAPRLHEASDDVTAQSQAAPIVRLVDHLLRTALTLRASDLHVEPGPTGCRIRYRVDGLLCEEQQLPVWMQAAVISRLKVLGRLDIAERRLPQDGSFRIRADGRDIDLRVALLPLSYGEKVVIRFLDQSSQVAGLETLGCSAVLLQQLRAVLRRTRGILLVTGPTGSGKTTTLYSMIQALNVPTRNIVTVEDPIEYQVSGVNQVQVNPDIGLTFAQVLRALLRQDPDIMLVGEIRDGETAEIAFRASMTGHLVLSTLHTNDAPSTVTRLLDLGVPRYLVASQLIGVVAQRLVRTICVHCRREVDAPEELLVALRLSPERMPSRRFFAGRGCPQCHGLGYRGRTAIFESLLLTTPLRELIASCSSEQALRAGALAAGMVSLGADGLEKVWKGITSLEEIARVTAADDACEELCPSCLALIQPDFLCCPQCGQAVRQCCPSCQRVLQQGWDYCPRCRYPAESTSKD